MIAQAEIHWRMISLLIVVFFIVTLYIKNTGEGEVTGSCWLFSSHFSYAWNEMKNQLLAFPNKSFTLQQLSTLCDYCESFDMSRASCLIVNPH